MSLDEKQLGKRLQRARQAAGMTQQMLCQKARLSYSTLAKIERGAIKTPSIFTIQSIATALGVSLDELVGAPMPTVTEKQGSKSGLRFVYFDVNDCLVERFFPRVLTKLAAESGLATNVIEDLFWRYDAEACRGDLSIAELNAIFARELRLPHFDWTPLYLETSQPMPGMHELVQWASQHFKLGLLSNSIAGLIPALIDHGILPNVTYDVIVDSSQVHALKPELPIFELAQKQAEVAPAEILFVDDMRPNILAAQKLGWHVMLFDGNRPAESIARLKEALALG